MFKSIKDGIGTAIGLTIGFAMIAFVDSEFKKRVSKDEEFMEYEKEHNPEMYERLKRFRR